MRHDSSPYSAFKSDAERRRALATQERHRTLRSALRLLTLLFGSFAVQAFPEVIARIAQ